MALQRGRLWKPSMQIGRSKLQFRFIEDPNGPNLVIVVSLLLSKIKKCMFFRGQPFSNMLKIKLVLADTRSYISIRSKSISQEHTPIQVNQGIILRECHPKEKLIWNVLE